MLGIKHVIYFVKKCNMEFVKKLDYITKLFMVNYNHRG